MDSQKLDGYNNENNSRYKIITIENRCGKEDNKISKELQKITKKIQDPKRRSQIPGMKRKSQQTIIFFKLQTKIIEVVGFIFSRNC